MRTAGFRRGVRPGPWLAALGLLLMAGMGSAHAAAGPASAPSPTLDYVNITTTSSFSFLPSAFTVYPGASVHLEIVQGSTAAHTFTLSSVANATIPSSDTASQLGAYFHAHLPLVNLSIPASTSKPVYRNFTAPPVGTYEFVCLFHFSSNGMHGVMTSSTSGVSGASPISIPPTELAIAAGALIVFLAGIVFVMRRRRLRAEALRPRRVKKR